MFFQQADLWVGSAVTVERCDERYDLLLLMYSKSVEKTLAIRQSCVHRCKLLNITVTAKSPTLALRMERVVETGQGDRAHVSACTHNCRALPIITLAKAGIDFSYCSPR